MDANQQILYDCRKATFSLEKELQTRLSLRESMELKLHLASCSVCRLYQSQTAIISTMVNKILNRGQLHELDDQFKTRLQEQIDQALEGRIK